MADSAGFEVLEVELLTKEKVSRRKYWRVAVLFKFIDLMEKEHVSTGSFSGQEKDKIRKPELTRIHLFNRLFSFNNNKENKRLYSQNRLLIMMK